MVSFTFAHTYTYIHTQFHSLSFFLFFFSRIDTFRVTSIQRISFAIFFLFPRLLPVFLLPFPFFSLFSSFSSSSQFLHCTFPFDATNATFKKKTYLYLMYIKDASLMKTRGREKKKRKKRKRKTFDNEISRKIVSFLRFLFRFRVPSLLISSI